MGISEDGGRAAHQGPGDAMMPTRSFRGIPTLTPFFSSRPEPVSWMRVIVSPFSVSVKPRHPKEDALLWVGCPSSATASARPAPKDFSNALVYPLGRGSPMGRKYCP